MALSTESRTALERNSRRMRPREPVQELPDSPSGERYGVSHIGGPPERVQPEERRDMSVGDDSGLQLIVALKESPVDGVPALPAPVLPSEMPANWWEALLLGKPGDAISLEDARLALALIKARLEGCQDSGPSIKRDPGATVSVGDELTATVGALHERIEQLYGSRGWFVFQQLYHEAAGLHPRRKPAEESRRPGCIRAASRQKSQMPYLQLTLCRSTAIRSSQGLPKRSARRRAECSAGC